MDNKDFSRFELSEAILQGINEMNITTPTKIQEASLLDIIQGEDVIGKAQTGTGKTLAFVAGLATRYPNSMGYLRGLILAPTRELAIQIQEEFMRICKYTHLSCLAVYGGSDIVKQIRQIKRGVDIIVGTPGRVMDLMDKRVIRLKDVDFVVIDEADEMLNMGFVEDIEYILKDASQDRQTLLFSATMPKSILKITETYLKKDAKKIFIEEKSSTSINVRQFYYEIRESERYEALCRLLDGYQIESAMIFCKTKKEVDELASWMVKSNYHVGFMHGDLSQESRLETLNRFKRGQLKYLVATDVASRGIDVKNVSHVINYTLPQDSESYVHRIGRCGRASQKGVAFSLVTTRELGMIHLIKKEQKATIEPRALPSLKHILEVKLNQVIEEVEEVRNQGLHKTYASMLQPYSKQELLQIASSLLYLQSKSHLGFDYRSDEIGIRPAVGTLFLDLGPNYAATTRQVMKHIVDVVGLKSADIGKISLENRGIQVDFTTKKAYQLALKYLPNTKLGKKTIKIIELRDEK